MHSKAAVRALMARESGGEADEQEAVATTEEEVKEWTVRKITFKRFQVSLARSKAMKGCGHDGWNDYLLRRAPEGLKRMYYDVVKEMIQQKEFPDGWKEWTATFAMKPREDPRELGRRRDLWSTCAGQKVVARMLAGAYDERAEETIPNNQGGFTKRWSAGGAHWALPMQRAQCRMEWRGGEGKVTQRLGDGRAGRDDNWRRMENEGRRQEKIRGTTPETPETEIVGTTEIPPKGGVGGGRRKWKSGEYMRYCREMRIDIWEGVWRRAGEEILPRRGVG